jgi:hypothetical protein
MSSYCPASGLTPQIPSALMGLNVVARRRGVEGLDQSLYRSTQSVCGDTADRLAPHQPAILRAARVLHERSHIAQLRRIGGAGLPFAESVCERCGMSQEVVLAETT